ncbi:uncharacterized protein DS421_20g702970 [Arachis hypogaea]|nr:uncharacterized protein DS421_20g702970 [Arachis hypogaea]
MEPVWDYQPLELIDAQFNSLGEVFMPAILDGFLSTPSDKTPSDVILPWKDATIIDLTSNR